MFTHRPLVLALGTCLLQACVAPQTKQASTTQMAIQPVLRMQHSAHLSAASYYQLGKYHQTRGQLGLARAAYDTSMAMDSRQLEARNAIAALDAQEGRLDEAKVLLRQIVADHPEIAHLHNNLGYVYYLQNDYDSALTHLQHALALDSGNAWARNNLVTVLAAQAKHVEHATVASGLDPQPANPNFPQQNESLTPSTAQTDTSAQGLVIKSPTIELQARMEVVQIVPNVYELRLKSAIQTVLADLQTKQVAATTSPSKPVHSNLALGSRVEIANGNGVPGMARKIKGVLGQQGIMVSRLTDARPYKQLTTKIQYRVGYQQSAEALKTALNGHAHVMLSDSLSAKSDVRLVLGKDVIPHIALIERSASAPLLALNDVSYR